jgi:hypothetical protein
MGDGRLLVFREGWDRGSVITANLRKVDKHLCPGQSSVFRQPWHLARLNIHTLMTISPSYLATLLFATSVVRDLHVAERKSHWNLSPKKQHQEKSMQNLVIFQVFKKVSLKIIVFWDGAPYSMGDVDRLFRRCLFIVLMMEAASTSETSANFYQIIRHNLPRQSSSNGISLKPHQLQVAFKQDPWQAGNRQDEDEDTNVHTSLAKSNWS